VTTPQYPYVEDILRGVSPDKICVLGGPHCNTYEIESKRFQYIIKKDGCDAFLQILDNKYDPKTSVPDDANQLPHRDVSLHRYNYFLDGKKTTIIMTSRGCPFSCAFCEHAGTQVRLKDVKTVEREIQECVDLGFGGIMFFDDLFCLNNKRVKELCDIIKPFDIKFRCFAHAKNFTEEIAKTLSGAGCVEIGYGAEHASQVILDNINKRTTTEQNYNIIKVAHKYGIRVKAFLMIGLPGENLETVKELEQFVLTSGVDDFDLCIFYPFKGTEISRNLESYDIYIEPHEQEGYFKGKLGKSSAIVSTSNLTKDEIVYWQTKIYSHNKRWK
jgi:radical SAM superfamily enzyme YgiQ (UPF0313 family)